jgi:hypothetical protein
LFDLYMSSSIVYIIEAYKIGQNQCYLNKVILQLTLIIKDIIIDI